MPSSAPRGRGHLERWEQILFVVGQTISIILFCLTNLKYFRVWVRFLEKKLLCTVPNPDRNRAELVHDYLGLTAILGNFCRSIDEKYGDLFSKGSFLLSESGVSEVSLICLRDGACRDESD